MSIITSDALPEYFNTSNDEIFFDKRSSAKGPEPETAVTGVINGVNYAFVALERTSGIMVYEISNPKNPKFVTFFSSRDFSEDVKGDVSPEGLRFISAEASPTGYPLLAATHEVSGTVAVYEFGGKEIKPVSEKPDNEKPVKEEKPSVTPKVYWDKLLMKKGQIGRITVEKPINLWKKEANNKLTFVRVLNPGEQYRVYNYDKQHSGQFGVGGGYYVTDIKGLVKYETPSKGKLAELNK